MGFIEEFDKIFVKEEQGGIRIAQFVNLRRQAEPNLPIAGLKRYCLSRGKFEKLIVETTGDRIEAKQFLSKNGIDVNEVREIKKPIVQEIVNKDIAPQPIPEEEKVQSYERKPKGMSEANKQKASDRMKKFHADKKEKENATRQEETSGTA